MLAQLRNEDQLAMVLAHEMTHYVHRHALGAVNPHLDSGSAVTSRSDTHDDSIKYGYRAHASHLRMAAEREADQEGLRLVKAAGFDQTRLIALLNDFREQPSETPVSDNRRALAGDIAEKSTSPPLDAKDSYRTDPQYTALIATALIANAKASLQEGLWELAEHNLCDYLRAYPDDPQAHFLRGEVQRRQLKNDQLQMAIQSYQKAIDLDQGFAPAYRELGVVQFKMGNLTAASRHFKTYLSMAPQAEGSNYVKGYLKLCGN
jgi:predicted Zn-dependent protease